MKRQGETMGAWLNVLLVLSASVGIAYAWPAQTPQRIENPRTIAQVIDLYNKDSRETSVFRLLKVDSAHRLEVPTSPVHLKFTIKETICPKAGELSTQECDFKDGGHSHTKRSLNTGTERRPCKGGRSQCPEKPSPDPRPGRHTSLSMRKPSSPEQLKILHKRSFAKRSLNTEGESPRTRKGPTRRKCTVGQDKCVKGKPTPTLAPRPGGWSIMGLHLPENTDLLKISDTEKK